MQGIIELYLWYPERLFMHISIIIVLFVLVICLSKILKYQGVISEKK